jgi:hypothetical protein
MSTIGKTILEAAKKYSQVPEAHFSDVITGTVTSVSPLKIKVGDKLELTDKNLILSAFVQETWINIPTTHGEAGADGVFMHRHEINAETELANDGQGADHKHAIKVYTEYALPKILLWRGLQVGDIVYLLRVAKGQTYFVIQRQQGITNEN